MAEEKASSRSRYVWDKDKMSWVDAADNIAVEEERIELRTTKRPEEPVEEEYPEVLAAEISPEYLKAEALENKGAWIRIVGVAIDFLVLGIFAAVTGAILNAFDISLGRYLLSIIGIGYFICFWAWRGQTPGKMAIGAKIVKTNGSPIGLGRAFLRYIGYFIYLAAIQYSLAYVGWVLAIFIFIAIFLALLLNKNKRGFHDLLAGTVVVNSRPAPLEEYDDYEEAVEDEEWAED